MLGLIVGLVGYTVVYHINEKIVDAGYKRRARAYHKEIRESAAAARIKPPPPPPRRSGDIEIKPIDRWAR